jgi:hypothetical protein
MPDDKPGSTAFTAISIVTFLFILGGGVLGFMRLQSIKNAKPRPAGPVAEQASSHIGKGTPGAAGGVGDATDEEDGGAPTDEEEKDE